jgi:hypothetical protein
LEALASVQGELEGHGFGVEKPAKHELARAPVGVAFVEFLDGDRFFAGRMIVVAEGAKQAINGMQENASDHRSTGKVALNGRPRGEARC